jgi:hypothetical protein
VLSDTLRYINLAEVALGLVELRGPMHLCACVSEEPGDGKVRARKRYHEIVKQRRLLSYQGCPCSDFDRQNSISSSMKLCEFQS